MALEESKTSAGPLSSPDSAGPAEEKPPAQAKPYEVSAEKATLNAIEKIWFIGPVLVVIYRIWSLQGLLLFVAGIVGGAILAASLLFFGAIPERFVPDKYRTASGGGTPSSEQPEPPDNDQPVAVVPDENQWSHWLNDLKLRFAYETNRLDISTNPRTTVLTLKNSLPHATTEFTWRLDVDPNHTPVLARGFRVTSAGLIYPLGKTEGVDTHFTVPACTKGDTLVAVVLTLTRAGSQDGFPVFQSTAITPGRLRK
jgi:hypothetical protein